MNFTSILIVVQAGVTVGPSRVGYKLTTQALVFGGNNMTATDIAVAWNCVMILEIRRKQNLMSRKTFVLGLWRRSRGKLKVQ